MTGRIFLNYRRDDSKGYTFAIFTVLEQHFSKEQIFMDVDTLLPGVDFVQALEEAVEACDVFLAVIGARWENIKDDQGRRRIDNPEDFVRIEVAHALKRGIPVIPILVDGAQMPSTENLPDDLKKLSRRHAFIIGDRLRSDVQGLVSVLEKTFKSLEAEQIKQEKAETERLAELEAGQKAREKAEEERKTKEQAEADRIVRAEADAKQKVQEQAELDRKVTKETKQKARVLAAAEKKEADDRKRFSRQKTKTAAAGQEHKAVSPTPSVFKKIPVWVWPVAGVVLILIGYGIFGGFSPTSLEEPEETGVNQAFTAYTNTPTSETISSTPTPEPEITPTITFTVIPTDTPTPAFPAGTEATNPKDSAAMIYVPPGDFNMGTFGSYEEALHTVYLDGYWIYKTEVTNAMFRLCVESGGCTEPVDNDYLYGWWDRPFEYASWGDAYIYCRWAENRLPTEAEWEKAARGTDGRTYPWGEGIDHSLALYDNYKGGDTTKVGSYPEGASPYGLLDMAGNVWEWVADWYGDSYYQNSPAQNPPGPESAASTGESRVLRGGASNSSIEELRSAYRTFDRWNAFTLRGFRCASSTKP
jgi:formylglycine-generating enzyme required for sulfatase activity